METCSSHAHKGDSRAQAPAGQHIAGVVHAEEYAVQSGEQGECGGKDGGCALVVGGDQRYEDGGREDGGAGGIARVA